MKILRSLNPYEESEIKDIQEKQRKLHLIPTPVCYLDIDVLDKNGEVVSKYSDRSKSWVRNFYNYCVCTQMGISTKVLGTSFGEGYLNLKDIAGTIYKTSSSSPYIGSTTDINSDIWWRANGGITDKGIIIGTDDSAENFDSYKLGSLIADGTATGQMNYLAMAAGSAVWSSAGKTMTQAVKRNIVNSSGATITVKEVGLIAYSCISSSYSSFLMARDLLNPAVDVAHESQIKVTYTVQITYP